MQADRHAGAETARDADRRHAGQVARNRRPIGDRAWRHIQRTVRFEGVTDARRDQRHARADDHVDLFEDGGEILLDQHPHLLTGEVLDRAHELSAADAGQHIRAIVRRALP